MRLLTAIKLTCATLLLTGIAIAATPSATGDTTADVVLGQADFAHNSINRADGAGMGKPVGTLVDGKGHLWVSDFANNRVLGWRTATSFSDGVSADLVIGQPDFVSTQCNQGGIGPNRLCQPVGLAADNTGNLFVTDSGNSRVLEFADPFSGCDGSFPCVGGDAALVIGQPDFVSDQCNQGGAVSGNSLCFSEWISLDANNNLWVSDSNNNRVLKFATPLVNDAAAALVLGQSDFLSNGCNQGASVPSAATLCQPQGVAAVTGRLYVADNTNNRVLEYVAPQNNGQAASVVLGQSDFASVECNQGGDVPAATTLCDPFELAVDGNKNLYVADSANDRVLEYQEPFVSGAAASSVWGQNGSFVTQVCGNGANSNPAPDSQGLCDPAGVAVDAGNKVYIADTGNNRVLRFASPIAAQAVIGQPDFARNGQNLPAAGGLWIPLGSAVDSSGHLYLADTDNNRVLGWHSVASFINGESADLVVGQSDFTTTRCNGGGIGKATLCQPVAVAVDSSKNLYVVDTENSRALEYPAPFASCQGFPCVGPPASVVLGQADFSGSECNRSGGAPDATTLCFPEGLTVDTSGNLFVSDSSNDRIVEFAAPLSNGASASLVLGQSDFMSDLCNRGNSAPDATTLCSPEGITADAPGGLYVTDANNDRVLEYTGPFSDGAGASLVIGQADFVSGTCNRSGSPGAATLCFPVDVILDASGNLYVADARNSRALEYNAPLASGATASMVFGQGGNFSGSQCADGSGTDPAPGADNSCDPGGLTIDKSTYDLYLADRGNQRLLVFDNPSGPGSGLPRAGTISAPLPITINTSSGQSVTAGSFKYLNASSGTQFISSVTVTVTNPTSFSSLTLTGGSSTATISPAQAVNQFVFDPPVQIAGNSRLVFSLTAQSGSPSGSGAAIALSAGLVGGGSGGSLPLALALMLSAAIAALISARNPRRSRAGLLALVVIVAACGGSSGGGARTGQTVSVSHNGLLSKAVSLSSVNLSGTSSAFELATLTFTTESGQSGAMSSVAQLSNSRRDSDRGPRAESRRVQPKHR